MRTCRLGPRVVLGGRDEVHRLVLDVELAHDFGLADFLDRVQFESISEEVLSDATLFLQLLGKFQYSRSRKIEKLPSIELRKERRREWTARDAESVRCKRQRLARVHGGAQRQSVKLQIAGYPLKHRGYQSCLARWLKGELTTLTPCWRRCRHKQCDPMRQACLRCPGPS